MPVSYTHLDVYKRQGKDYIILSPSVYYWAPWVEKAKQNGTEVVSELQLGAWFTQGDFVAVTGTNGKTTTTTLIGEIFKANGNRTHVLDVYKRQGAGRRGRDGRPG